ncbi:hypothetical protein DENSPDRAFT_234171 [Dentipellis sp. KUC8613]|nr:hypothetical protein DENSPDRAFT_234171 [Dentipellis sp. KUC8613]
MRESNFAFPAQNRASVCISSQLYDRRALDTSSSLPLFNSLTHLTYLTSTSPRIREIMTMDGGLERLVRILLDFCISPPPPDNPAVLYGLLPPNHHPAPPVPTLNPKSFDKQAAYRFSLAFQSVVNIGVRGNEPIRARVVQAGMLEVVGCILEAWLANKGFAVGPSSSATGIPRETREQRAARRQAQAEQRTRQQAQELARALERQQIARSDFERIARRRTGRATADETTTEDDDMPLADPVPARLDRSNASSPSPPPDPQSAAASVDTDADTSTDISTNTTPAGSNTPTGAVEVPGRDRSGTIIARPVWDHNAPTVRRPHRARDRQGTIRQGSVSASTSRGPSRPETETEDDGDGDVDMDRDQVGLTSTSPSPEPMSMPIPHNAQGSPHTRRTVGIVSDASPTNAPGASLELNSDAHIIINQDQDVGEGIVSLEANDDFAMGAPPGAPGAIEPARTVRAADHAGTIRRARNGTDVTPRAVNVSLPFTGNAGTGRNRGQDSDEGGQETTPVRPNAPMQRNLPLPAVRNLGQPNDNNANTNAVRAATVGQIVHHHHHRDPESGLYRDEDVLVSLQLLAYLSKYPHVRQAFYKPRTSFHPAAANLPNPAVAERERQTAAAVPPAPTAGPSHRPGDVLTPSPGSPFYHGRGAAGASGAGAGSGFFKTFGRGKEKEKEKERIAFVPPAPTPAAPRPPPRQTNMFSLIERFTFRPSSSESDLPNPPPTLPADIQYWAGVIMRNACRKDENRGGIRQCANMLCGRWESYPREFAKCRRCRKAKYCGKECQSTAWSEGHRFWCSAKEEETTEGAARDGAEEGDEARAAARERRSDRDRDRERVRERVNATTAAGGMDHAEIARAVAHAVRQVDRTVPPPADGARHAGWGRAYYEPSPFANGAGPEGEMGGAQFMPAARGARAAEESTGGRRRAETMPGGMVPVVDSPAPLRALDRSRFFNSPARGDVAAIAGPSRILPQDEGELFAITGDLSMDID